jgi:hypothetical protein
MGLGPRRRADQLAHQSQPFTVRLRGIEHEHFGQREIAHEVNQIVDGALAERAGFEPAGGV